MRTAVLVAGAAALALALSVLYYVAEERVERSPADPVRIMGALLGTAACVFAASTVLRWRSKTGVTVPVIPLFTVVLSVTLLRVERP